MASNPGQATFLLLYEKWNILSYGNVMSIVTVDNVHTVPAVFSNLLKIHMRQKCSFIQ